jgi:hypothetical protein
MSILIRSRGQEALFICDVHRPELSFIFALDKELAQASRRWLLNYAADRTPMLFTAHFPQSSIGYLTCGAGGYEWHYNVWRTI